MVKFAHIADCHLGVWRQPELQELSVKAFEQAIDCCISEKVAFVLIAGDLFDNAMPSIEVLKEATLKLKELKESKIGCYVIPGSHDFSVSGKTFLDVLENAGLFVNVAKYDETEDAVELKFFNKNNVTIAGLPGKKAGLEKNLIAKIKETGMKEKNVLKILVLHTMLTEAKPEGMDFVDSIDSAMLPAGFNYYALGHLHKYFNEKIKDKVLVYPGPLFPANFSEFEELGKGSFCIVEWNEKTEKIKTEKREVLPKKIICLAIDASNSSPEQAAEKAIKQISSINECIIALRFKGMLSRGKTSDIDFVKINETAVKNDNILLRNTSLLKSPEFQLEVKSEGRDIDEIEKDIIEKYGKKNEYKEFFEIIGNLIYALDMEKQEGETNTTFEKRLIDGANKIFEIR